MKLLNFFNKKSEIHAVWNFNKCFWDITMSSLGRYKSCKYANYVQSYWNISRGYIRFTIMNRYDWKNVQSNDHYGKYIKIKFFIKFFSFLDLFTNMRINIIKRKLDYKHSKFFFSSNVNISRRFLKETEKTWFYS